MSLQLPNQSRYQEKVYEISDIFKKLVSTATTAVGSGIYELVIRPTSAIYAAIIDSIDKWHKEYTLEYLSKSTNREQGPADVILSNYFITRNDGRMASAVVTVYSTDTFTKIPKGTVFDAAGTALYASDTVFGSYLMWDPTEDGTYSKAYKSGDFYCFTVPVNTDGPTSEIISEGITVDLISYIPNVDHVVLSSALEGGSDVETDAEMVARARESVMSWIGCSASIHKILKTSGFTLYSSKSFDSKDAEMNRASGSNLFINTGSMIDTYVKTSMYPKTGHTTIDTGNSVLIDITRYIPAGTISITNVINNAGSSIGYDVQWGSSADDITPEGARFSSYQTSVISIDEITSSITVSYTYMPYISELQSYIDMPDNRMLGWDILVKAAIPAVLNIRGSLHLPATDVDSIIQDVANYINNTNVGCSTINLADIQSVVSANHNNILSSPVIMTATCYGHDGSNYVCSSSSGVLDITGSGTVTSNMMFPCIETSGVLVE